MLEQKKHLDRRLNHGDVLLGERETEMEEKVLEEMMRWPKTRAMMKLSLKAIITVPLN